MGNLVYLVAALGLAALGTLFLVWRARTPSGMQHNIRNFADQLDSLAPERRRVVPRPYDLHIPPVDHVAPIYRSVKLVVPEAPEVPEAEAEAGVGPMVEPDGLDVDTSLDEVLGTGRRFSLRPNSTAVHVSAIDASANEAAASADAIDLVDAPEVPSAGSDGPRPVHAALDVLDPRSFDVPAFVPGDETSEMDRARLAALALPSAIDPATLPPIEELLNRQPSASDPLVLPKNDAVESSVDHS
jgi:hypothetical protein